MMITNVKGRFGKFEGTVEYDPAHPELSKFEATLDAASIDTREEKRDAHLRSADFFDAENHPKLTFKSREVTKTADGFTAVGDLTIRGISKPITLEIEGPTEPSQDPWATPASARRRTPRSTARKRGLNYNAVLEAAACSSVRPSRSRSRSRSSRRSDPPATRCDT